MIPLPESTRPAQQFGSTPPSREECHRENYREKTLTDFDLEQRVNRGLIVEQRGLEEREGGA